MTHLNVLREHTVEEMDIRSPEVNEVLEFLDGSGLHCEESETTL